MSTQSESNERPDWLPKMRYLKLAGGWQVDGFISEEEYTRLGIDSKHHRPYEDSYIPVLLDPTFDEEYMALEREIQTNNGIRDSRMEKPSNQEQWLRQQKMIEASQVHPAERKLFIALYDELRDLREFLDSSQSYDPRLEEVRAKKQELQTALKEAIVKFQFGKDASTSTISP